MEMYAVWVLKRSCTDKVRYYSKGAARAGGRRLYRIWRRHFKPYRCTICEGWHLTRKKEA